MKKTMLALAAVMLPATAMAQSTALDVFQWEPNPATQIDTRDTRSIVSQAKDEEQRARLGDGSPAYGRY
ncbi:MAG: hypothetical protein ABL307_11860 [Roseitalea porphyridii]|uniref:hypothetical protein n=1 Tax=Roseitalea porphyridii TaxID=1852022 RepID=UPI0032D97AA8